MPMAVTTQMVAALVSPVTEPLWCRMVPAPMKPMPVRICAAILPGSPPMTVKCSDRRVNMVAPRPMRMLVRRPAGLPFSSRSMPMMPLSSTDNASCVRRS